MATTVLVSTVLSLTIVTANQYLGVAHSVDIAATTLYKFNQLPSQLVFKEL